MDPLSHGLAGALAGAATASRGETRPAAAVGCTAALVPDLDILVRSADDPLLALEFHRGFTHALAVVPVIALLVSLAAWPFARRFIGPGGLGRAALLGAATAGPLDACTTYGTALLWPFSDARVALAVVSVVDPLLTTLLLAALAALLVRQSRVWALWGLTLGVVYLGLGWVQHQRAGFVAEVLANDRGHRIERVEVKPTLGNLLLWRTVYLSSGLFHVDAVRLGLAADIEIYPGSSIARIEPAAIPLTPGSKQARDTERFARLAEGYTVFHPRYPFVIGDVRYAMLPDSVEPLWGIRIDPGAEGSHVEYVTFREMGSETLDAFLAMLLGTSESQPTAPRT